MESQIIESDLSSTTAAATTLLTNTSADLYNKAWNLLRILLEIGHPVPPVNLTSSSISVSFESSPEFIEFLCSLPDSPLSLTSDSQFVTISTLPLAAFSRFLINTNVISALLPRLRLDDFRPKKVWEDVERTYYRKRMRLRSHVVVPEEEEPLLKRRAILQNADAEKDLYVVLGLRASTKEPLHLKDSMKRSMIMDQGESPVRTFYPKKSDEEATTSLTVVSYELSSDGHISAKKVDTSVSKNEHECICKLGLEYSFHKYEKFHLLSNSILERVKAFMPYNRTFHLNINPVLRREDMIKNIYFLSLNSGSASCQAVDEHKRTSSVEANNSMSSHKPVNTNSSIAERSLEGREQITDSCIQKENTENFQINTISMGMPRSSLRCIDKLPSLEERTTSCKEIGEPNLISPVELGNTCPHQAQNAESPKDERLNNREDELLIDSGNGGDLKSQPVISPSLDMPSLSYLAQEKTEVNLMSKVSVTMLSLAQKQLTAPHANLKLVSKDAINRKAQTMSKVIVRRNSSGACVEPQQFNVGKRSISTKQKVKKNCNTKTHVIEKRENTVENKETPCSMKNQLEPKVLPNFDSFIVVEEEGSGGYGTVYKAKRKKDGATFAVKCPHANANRHHVLNELKILERFGGRNFVIKCEGSFQTENYDCIVLEHFEHDRPEVLKREIDVFQLQWYGFCLFRALASLHKQGVVHRDAKPGNFLFSRKVNKGYLIDFNLALDVHQKYGSPEKSKVLSFGHAPLPHTESLPPAKRRKLPSSKAFEAAYQEAGNRSKSLLKSLKKKNDQAKGNPGLNKNSILKSQGAEGSGITSTKDATSTRVTSVERLREPIPCQGRKELICLAQEAMQSPNQEIINIPASKRKRVVAAPGKVDKNFVHLTPMPLHSTGIAVAGAGLLKTKGEGKHRKEGPCVGTKGFRAPEVLLRSTYQGPKVDIWSAGVTLLYLMTGRAPFVGDTDQNIKEIAKLRGSEEIWEVAKLHNRESSFPAELLDINSLPSTKLREWCKLNTRRADFHESIPRSLFDLVDKCLTVNPRLRLSAEEALRHEFFAPCVEQIKKQRMTRQGLNLDPGTTFVLETLPQTCEGLS